MLTVRSSSIRCLDSRQYGIDVARATGLREQLQFRMIERFLYDRSADDETERKAASPYDE